MDNKTFNAVYEAISGIEKKSDICRKYDITRSKLDWNLNLFLRETQETHELRNQMFLGSKLGDGYFQKTRNDTYKYRESHSIGEIEYAKWKYLILQSYHKNTRVINKNSGTACELYTTSSCSQQIKKYYDMDIEDVINKINIYGLLFYLLDDGWYSNHSKCGNFLIGSCILSDKQKLMIIGVFERYSIKATLVGSRSDISIDSTYNLTLLSYLLHIIPTLDMDVIIKKFGNIIVRGIV